MTRSWPSCSEYRERIAAAEPTLAPTGLEPEQLDRSRKIFAECRAFLDSVEKAGGARVRIVSRSRRMTPMVMKNAAEARPGRARCAPSLVSAPGDRR